MAFAGTPKRSVKFVNPGSKVAINPQPEPPGKASSKFVHPGASLAQPSGANPEMQKASGGDNGVGEHKMSGGDNGVGE